MENEFSRVFFCHDKKASIASILLLSCQCILNVKHLLTDYFRVYNLTLIQDRITWLIMCIA